MMGILLTCVHKLSLESDLEIFQFRCEINPDFFFLCERKMKLQWCT